LSFGFCSVIKIVLSNHGAHTLTFESLTVGYDKPLLQQLSCSFTSPSVSGIIGNNGKGKTTLLKSLGGLQKPLSGKILFNGKDVCAMSDHQRAAIVSLNFSSNPVSFPISVYELVSMGRYPYTNQWAGLSPGDKQVIEEALDLCGVMNFRNNWVNTLSDGERQKVFIAKAIAQEAEVMLFDEPTAFLDYSSKKYFFKLMKDIAIRKNKIILISSHDIDFLIAYTNNIVMIENDETVLFGSTEDVLKSPYFKTHFTK